MTNQKINVFSSCTSRLVRRDFTFWLTGKGKKKGLGKENEKRWEDKEKLNMKENAFLSLPFFPFFVPKTFFSWSFPISFVYFFSHNIFVKFFPHSMLFIVGETVVYHKILTIGIPKFFPTIWSVYISIYIKNY